MKNSQPTPGTVDLHEIFVGAAQLIQVNVLPKTKFTQAHEHFHPKSFKKNASLEFKSTASFSTSSSNEIQPHAIEFYRGDEPIFSPPTLNSRRDRNNPPHQLSYVISVNEVKGENRQRYSFYLMYIPNKNKYTQAWVHFPKATIDFMVNPQCMSYLNQQLQGSSLPKLETRNGYDGLTKINNFLKALSYNAPQRKNLPVRYFKQWWVIYNDCINSFFNKTATPLQPNLPVLTTPQKTQALSTSASNDNELGIHFDKTHYQLIANNILVKDGKQFRAAEIHQHTTQFHLVISYRDGVDDEFEGIPLPGHEGDYWAFRLPSGRSRISRYNVIKETIRNLNGLLIYFTDREKENKLIRVETKLPQKRHHNQITDATPNKKQKRQDKNAPLSAFLYEESPISATQRNGLSSPSAAPNVHPFEVNHCVALLHCYSQQLRSPSFNIHHLKAMAATLDLWLPLSRPQDYPCIQQQAQALTDQISGTLTDTQSTPFATRMHLSLFNAKLRSHLSAMSPPELASPRKDP